MSGSRHHHDETSAFATDEGQTTDVFSRVRRRILATVLISLALHGGLLLALGLWLRPVDLKRELISLLVSPASDDAEQPESEIDIVVQPDTLIESDVDDSASSVELLQLEPMTTSVSLKIDDQDIAAAIELAEADAVLSAVRGDLGGRSEKGRMAAVRKFGGSADSERAVASGLRWLASIQQKNGSWDFTDVGEAGGGGILGNGQMGATAMSLLCFLGAGHSHGSETEYSDTVTQGLRYLIKNKKTVAHEADLRGNELGNGGMYIQGLATIALCEAHALTRGGKHEDKLLRDTAQDALRFIESAQDPKGGGWRYKPMDPGDTSVVGWQVMALKSGQAGRLRVQSKVFPGARRFLKSVQVEGGAQYGYTRPQKNREGTTAIGLLCRMYLGWKPDNEALQRGVTDLSKRGPSNEDIYYNYYATQVMHHWGGEEWSEWNSEMRPKLVQSQVRNGPGAGSWNPRGGHSRQGGRIYQTAFSIMTLEVYYRHLPLYRRLEGSRKDEAVGG